MAAIEPPADPATQWQSVLDELPQLLRRLRGAPATVQPAGIRVPARPGVYLFSEGSRPVYVGQTRNLRRRWAQHSSPWAKQNQASFAFGRARAKFLTSSPHSRFHTRRDLAADPSFSRLFAAERERVALMAFQFVEVSDPELRTVFEVYASIVLGTENTFETH